jgi:hypothetical protein
MSSHPDPSFEPLVVLHFSPTTPVQTKEWVIKRLTASQDEDEGAGLLVRYDTDPESHVRILFPSFHINFFFIRIIFF